MKLSVVNVMRALVFEILTSYKALFTWLDKRTYFLVKIVIPFFYIAFFSYLGKFVAGAEGMKYAAFGNAILLMGLNTVAGVVISIGIEKTFGTLSPLFITPANRFRIFISRAIFHAIDGTFNVMIGLVYAILFFEVELSLIQLGQILLVSLLTSFTMMGYGLLFGSYSLYVRDVGMVMNAAYFILMFICGVNFPVESLPEYVRVLSYIVPLTYGLQVARAILSGDYITDCIPLLIFEVLWGCVMLIIGYFLFIYFENKLRRRGTLDVI